MVPVVSADLPDPWDPLAWLEPLASLDVRYEETIIPDHEVYLSAFSVLVYLSLFPNQLTCFVL